MRVLITYPVGLLLKAYIQCAFVLIKIKERRSKGKVLVKPMETQKPSIVKELELQTA